jgi:serine/threonine protein phosphatase PrpC
VEVDDGRLVLLATDGLANAFTDERQFHTFAGSLAARIREFGIGKVAAALPGWLDAYSEQGSGDDITLALVSLNGSEAELVVEVATGDPVVREEDGDAADRAEREGGATGRQPDRDEEAG